ncbi:MAG: DUF192 domain-containing protein [Aquificaceae bacterium]|nr:DUF192 domain-containing protein [Aquificaceae bacterium]
MLMIFNTMCALFLSFIISFSQVPVCRLMVADTPQEHERGLMNYRSLVGYDGMVFLYKNKAIRHFWNKNTYLELDIYWIDSGRVVGKSYLPPVDKYGVVTVSSPAPVDTVVELLRGRRCLYNNILLSPELESGKGKNTQ